MVSMYHAPELTKAYKYPQMKASASCSHPLPTSMQATQMNADKKYYVLCIYVHLRRKCVLVIFN